MEPAVFLRHIPRNMWRTWERVNFPINGLEFYAPLWHPELSGSPFLSKDLNAHSCAVTGATHGIQGRTFDGSDDYIDISAVVTDGKLGNAFTLWCWGKVTKYTANQSFVGSGNKVDGASSGGFYFNNSDDMIIAQTSTQVTSNSLASLNTYTNDVGWHFFIMMVDADGKINNYLIDGVSQGSATTNSPDLSSHIYMYIGQLPYASANINPLQGTVGEVGLCTWELSTLEAEHIRLSTRWKYI